MIKFKSTKYKYGERERGRSTSLLLSKELKEKMDEVCGGEGQRSSWAERWLRLAVAVQMEDRKAVEKWVEWAVSQSEHPYELAWMIGEVYGRFDIVLPEGLG